MNAGTLPRRSATPRGRLRGHSGSSRRLAAAWARHGPVAVRVAFSLTGDRERAVGLATASVRLALGTWRDVRGPEEMQIYVLRRVIRRSHRWRGGAEAREARDWARVGHRRRAALTLVLGEELDPSEAARILECSRATIDSLVRKGLARWGATGSEEGGSRGRLSSWLRHLQDEVREHHAAPALRPVGLLRAASVACLVLALAGVTAGTVAAGRRITAPPAASIAEGAPHRPAERDGSIPAPRVGLMDSRRDWCPDPDYTLPFGRRPGAKAARVALAFDAALVENDWRTIAELIDPSPLALGMRQRKWDSTELAHGLTVTYSESAALDEPVRSFCGLRVAARSWKVVMHDANGITSDGLAAFYLVRRATGWKVWGSY
jgi:DNA-directed RNA polymerase specialized sigma24 family protein